MPSGKTNLSEVLTPPEQSNLSQTKESGSGDGSTHSPRGNGPRKGGDGARIVRNFQNKFFHDAEVGEVVAEVCPGLKPEIEASLEQKMWPRDRRALKRILMIQSLWPRSMLTPHPLKLASPPLNRPTPLQIPRTLLMKQFGSHNRDQKNMQLHRGNQAILRPTYIKPRLEKLSLGSFGDSSYLMRRTLMRRLRNPIGKNSLKSFLRAQMYPSATKEMRCLMKG